MRFFVLFASLLLAGCGLPGTGPGEWTTMPPLRQVQIEDEEGGTRPPLPDPPKRSIGARTIAAAEETATAASTRAPTEAAPATAPAEVPTAPAASESGPDESAATQPGGGQPNDGGVELLTSVSLSDVQVRAVQAGLRVSWRDDSAVLQRLTAGRNTLGVVFVCGYADVIAGGDRRSQAFRGVMIGRDRAQPRFAPATGPGTDERTTTELCRQQGIPLSAAQTVAAAPAAPEVPTEPAPDSSAQSAAVSERPASPVVGTTPTPATAAGPAAPLPRVPLSESHINAVKTGVKASLEADAPVFGRMLAVVDTKGGIVVCGYVSPGEAGSLQPFTGVLVGEGDARKFVPVGFGRNAAEQNETMQVCARQGIPL